MAKSKGRKRLTRAQRRAQERKRKQEQQVRIIRIGGIVLAALLLAGALWYLLPELLPEREAEPVAGAIAGERPLAAIEPAARNAYYSERPPITIDTSKEYEAVIRSEQGDMRFRLFDDEAPVTVNNFVFLATQGFYDGTTFHRVLADFMAQGGDPTGTGTGGPGYQFEDETDNGLTFDRRGLLAMANAGPGTNGSQFFITFAPTPHLNGAHTIFGELIAGDDVLAGLRLRDPLAATEPGDRIERIDIIEK